MFEEPLSEAWKTRFGTAPPDLPFEPGRFLNHRSVRAFLPEPIPESTIQYLVGCARSSACSSHLQLGTMISVQDKARRAAINVCCHNQEQIEEAAWFFAFCLDTHRLREIAKSHGGEAPSMNTVEMLILGCIDTAIMAERMVCAAEAIGLGICYIGALRNDPVKVSEILALPDGVIGLFGLCVGLPDATRDPGIKPRLAQEAVWHREQYREPSWTEFDDRMRGYFASHGQNEDYSWSARTARRGEDSYMIERLVLKEFLDSKRLNQR